MNKNILIVLVLFSPIMLFGQITQYVIGGSGGGESSSNNSPSIIFTLGDIGGAPTTEITSGFIQCFKCPNLVSSANNRSDIASYKVFPNPSKESLTIENFEVLEVENYRILNYQGIMVEESFLKNNEISIRNLSSGYYILQFFDKTGQLKARSTFIKQ
jgi:hypothetical protein